MEKDAGEKTVAWLDKIRNSNGSLPTSKIRLNMQRVMQNNAAVFRTQETLEEGMSCFLIINVFVLFHRFFVDLAIRVSVSCSCFSRVMTCIFPVSIRVLVFFKN